MADSSITKRALASALTELMNEMPFSKISVGDICEKCDMNRKSFYYHFKDKYDLVNWIFDIGFVSAMTGSPYRSMGSAQEYGEVLFEYLYEHRSFYRKAFSITGQNGFSEHFREVIRTLFTDKVRELSNNKENAAFATYFLTDALVCAIERWLSDKNCVPPDVFYASLRASLSLCGRFSDNDKDGSV